MRFRCATEVYDYLKGCKGTMADNVQANEVVLRFWSKEAKDAFLGGFIDGWGEERVQVDWPTDAGGVRNATHLEVQNFYDPVRPPRDEHHFGNYWHCPGCYNEADKHDALIAAQEEDDPGELKEWQDFDPDC